VARCVSADAAAARRAAALAQERGNEALKRGSPFYLRHAAAFYTQAIEQRGSDAAANSVYHANRAQAHLQLRNWGKALADARAALLCNAGNVKARQRGRARRDKERTR
jgi:hypothetical protein